MSEDKDHEDYYLRLSSSKIKFNGINKSGLVSVFYDESNSQVFNVISGDVTEVFVKSLDRRFCHHFKMTERGQVLTIKFSPDQKILSLQRNKTALEFMTIDGERVVKEFTETFKCLQVLGCVWASSKEVAVITDSSVRLFRIDMNTCTLTSLQNVNVKVNWFSFYSPLCVILVSVQSATNEMQLLQIKSGQILSHKFMIEFDPKARRPIDRDVVLGIIYNKPRILVVSSQTVNSNVQREVVIYTVFKMSRVRKTHVLRLHDEGRVALNIVDNVIVVHQQLTSTSLIFDLNHSAIDGVTYLNPEVLGKSIQPYFEDDKVFEMYSASWIAFQPDVIIDVKAGYLWALELNLPGFSTVFPSPRKLVKFFLLRKDSRHVIARALLKVAENPTQVEDLGDLFDQINSVYRLLNDRNLKSMTALPLSSSKIEEEEATEFRTVLDPEFINARLFSPLIERISCEPCTTENQRQQLKHLTWIILEYIRSLADFLIPAPHFLCEILIDALVKTKNFYQLYQLLQYQAVGDSKPLACLLLSLGNVYPPSTQLAIDMLERLGTATDEITEILLSNKQVLQSLRYSLEHSSSPDRINPAKFLEPAKQMNDPGLYYSVLKHFDCQPLLE